MKKKYLIRPAYALAALALLATLIMPLSSCKVAKGVAMMNKKTAEEQTLVLQDKTIKFIPIMHFGRKEFYSSLKQKIKDYKGEGYTVYYEQIIGRFSALNLSRESYDTLRRAYRKMNGGQGHSRDDYKEALGDVFKNKMVQPLYDSLGVTATDVNADITLIRFRGEYERLYGKIQFEPCDFQTPLDSPYVCSKLKHPATAVIEDFRNENLASMLRDAKEKKILVLYGANHIKPVMKLLKKKS